MSELAKELERACTKWREASQNDFSAVRDQTLKSLGDDVDRILWNNLDTIIAALRPEPPVVDHETPSDVTQEALCSTDEQQEPPADMVEAWDRLKNHLWQITKLSDDDAPYMRSIAEDTLQAISAINIQAALRPDPPADMVVKVAREIQRVDQSDILQAVHLGMAYAALSAINLPALLAAERAKVLEEAAEVSWDAAKLKPQEGESPGQWMIRCYRNAIRERKGS